MGIRKPGQLARPYRPIIANEKLRRKMDMVYLLHFKKDMSISAFYEHALGQWLLQENYATTDEIK